MTQERLDKYYIKVAQVCAKNSYAIKLKVGAIIVKDNQIISDGFNGTPSGFENKDSMVYKELSIKGVAYYIYQTNATVTCTDFTYTFSY